MVSSQGTTLNLRSRQLIASHGVLGRGDCDIGGLKRATHSQDMET